MSDRERSGVSPGSAGDAIQMSAHDHGNCELCDELERGLTRCREALREIADMAKQGAEGVMRLYFLNKIEARARQSLSMADPAGPADDDAERLATIARHLVAPCECVGAENLRLCTNCDELPSDLAWLFGYASRLQRERERFRAALERLSTGCGFVAIGGYPDDMWGREVKARIEYAAAVLSAGTEAKPKPSNETHAGLPPHEERPRPEPGARYNDVMRQREHVDSCPQCQRFGHKTCPAYPVASSPPAPPADAA